jgi:hypothetical protein
MRATAITELLRVRPLQDVQDFARHKDPRTTRRYDKQRGNLDRGTATTSYAYNQANQLTTYTPPTGTPTTYSYNGDGTPQWYDVTTENSWLAHVARYSTFGEGTGIFYGGG